MVKKKLLMNLILIFLLDFLKNIYNNFLFWNLFFVDQYSFFLILLVFIISVTLINIYMSTLSYMSLIFLLIFLTFTFSSTSSLQFYMFFELSLMPIFLIVTQMGKQEERLKASFFLFFFTLFSSLPFLFILLNLQFYWFKMFNDENFFFSKSILFIFFFLSFFVKLPIFFFHSWLPKAHVQAPVYGSMILASILLKMGGFGLYKFLFYFFNFWLSVNFFFKSITIYGMIISGLMCLYLTDLKVIIAMSSVSHMSFMTSSMINLSNDNYVGSILLMVSHGFSSALMFFFFDVIYKRLKTRSIFFSKSNFSYYVSLTLILVCVVNFGIPPSLNFFSEIVMTVSILSWLNCLLVFVFVYMYVNTFFSLVLFFLIKDKMKSNFFFMKDLNLNELTIVAFYFVIIFFSSLLISKISN